MKDPMELPVSEMSPRQEIARRRAGTLIIGGCVFGVISVFSTSVVTGFAAAIVASICIAEGVSNFIAVKRFL